MRALRLWLPLLAAAAVAARPSSSEQMLVDLAARTETVREDALRRLIEVQDLTDEQVRTALRAASGPARPLVLRVVAARRMIGLVPEVVADLSAPDPAVADAAARTLVSLGDDAVAAGMIALASAKEAADVSTRIHLQALSSQRSVERAVVGAWRRKGGMYRGRFKGLAKLGWAVQPVLLAMLLDVPVSDHHIVLPEIRDPRVLRAVKTSELEDIFRSDRRGYATFEPLPPQIEPSELFELAAQALRDVGDAEVMGDILVTTSEQLEYIDTDAGWRLRRIEQAYFTYIDEILFAQGRPARLERLGKKRWRDMNRMRNWVSGARAEERPDALAAYSNALTEYAAVLHQLGRFDEAEKLFSEVIAINREFNDKDQAIQGYNRACALAQAGRTEEAIMQLARALDREKSSGSEDLTREWVMEDGDLAPLHDDARFKALVKRRYDE